MNCADARASLAGLAYGDLPPPQRRQLEDHVENCPVCRRELAGLEELRRLLDEAPVPEVRVDLARVYALAAQGHERRARRWRRLAFSVTTAAAAVLVVGLVLRFELRFERHQLVLRWGTPPEALPASPPEAVPSVYADIRPPAGDTEQVQLLGEILRALARDVRILEQQQQKDTSELRTHLRVVQQQGQQHWETLARRLDAMYQLTQRGE